MRSAITSKFQTTIPRKIRKDLSLSINDTLEWQFDRGRAVVRPVKKPFLQYRNTVQSGSGNISGDIKTARKLRSEKCK